MRRPSTLERDAALRVLRRANDQELPLSTEERETLCRLALASVMGDRLAPAELKEAQTILCRCDAAAGARPEDAPQRPGRAFGRRGAVWRPMAVATGIGAVVISGAFVMTGAANDESRPAVVEAATVAEKCLPAADAAHPGYADLVTVQNKVAGDHRAAPCPAPVAKPDGKTRSS